MDRPYAFGTLVFWKNTDYEFSVPCHEEITIHIILMRKESKGVSERSKYW